MGRLEKLKIVAAGLLLAAAPVVSHAVPVIFTFTTEFSGSGSDCGGDCATLSVEQVGDDVHFVLTASLSGAEKITSLYGNIDPYAQVTPSSVNGTTDATYVFGNGNGTPDTFKADGDGDFDWAFDFPTGGNTLNGVETFTWTFLDTDIDDIINAISVGGPVGKTGFTFAMHVQGLGTGGTGSGWFSGTPPDDTPGVPEPGTLALLGLALGVLGISRRRRR